MTQRCHEEPEHDEQSLFQDFDEQTFFQYGEPEFSTEDDQRMVGARSGILGSYEMLDDSMEEWDELSMAQRCHTEPEHDESSLYQNFDEQPFQFDEIIEEEDGDESSFAQACHTEPEHDEQSLFQDFDEPDNGHPSVRSRRPELLDDSMEEWDDEYSMVQHGHPEPTHDEHSLFQEPTSDEQSLFQDFDENTFFQYGEPEFNTEDDQRMVGARSGILGSYEMLDDSMEECDEYAMIQTEHASLEDEQSLFQHDEAETVDDALEEESAVEDYILMQYEGSEYPNLLDQAAVIEARSEILNKGDPNRFFTKEEL